jgi:cytochrome P450
MMQSITLDTILRTVFGVADSSAHRELRGRLVDILEQASNQWLLLPGMLGIDPFKVPWLRITKLKRAMDDSVYRLIADRRREPAGGTDVLAMMLAARDDEGRAMTDTEIRDELVTLLPAGPRDHRDRAGVDVRLPAREPEHVRQARRRARRRSRVPTSTR